jgi:vitamin K-dependent gamma-carboxylase
MSSLGAITLPLPKRSGVATERLAAALARPIDSASLVVFRVFLGLLVSVGAARFIFNGWIERFYVEPTFFFKYWGFSWVAVWPAWGMYLHFAALVALGLCIAAGLFYRVAASLCFVAFTYLELMDVTNYLNHYYLLSLLLLIAAVMPLHRAASLDAWRRPATAAETLPAWCLYLVRFQLAVVYFYAGLAKVGPDWLFHAQPLDIWLSARSDIWLLGPLFALRETAVAMSWAGCLYDLTIWGFLLWTRTRPFAFAVVVVFHTLVGVLFSIGMFPFIMTLSALVFFSPSWPRWLVDRVRRTLGAGEGPGADVVRTRGEPHPVRRWALGLGALFVALQVLVPLRHFAYPGDVLWNEQGMRWAWKVMVREKNGDLSYRVVDESGRTRVELPRRYLRDYQEREMATQPDLILQLAHHIAAKHRKAGREVSIYADAWVSLNGRAPHQLVDPSVDLTTVSDGLGRADWVLPAPDGPPPHLEAP